jgi:histidinol dehydrogenase
MNIQLSPVIRWSAGSETEREAALARPPADAANISSDVAAIIEQVRGGGDGALRELTRKFDGVDLRDIEISDEEWAAAETSVDAATLDAIDEAIGRIELFHAAGVPRPYAVETAPGLSCEARYVPISPAGLYVPGGSAPLISTVLMLAVPARIAGCGQVVLCTPPDRDGRVSPAILAAAARCGVTRVFKAGGAQAIAAMGLGTESIPACAKLFGPGNAWVTEAKQQLAALPDGAALDMPAGPSEVLVIADGDADPEALCWDLLSQAEHGPDSQSLLLSDDERLLEDVGRRLPGLAAGLPRAEILSQSLRHLRRIAVNSVASALEVSNRYAPEHLILNCRDADRLADGVTAAGSVFVGPWTPESLGDYCSGTNHVLPTYGYARAYGGLSVRDFVRYMTLQRASADGLAAAGPCAAKLAGAEGLDAHRLAVEYRLGNGGGDT